MPFIKVLDQKNKTNKTIAFDHSKDSFEKFKEKGCKHLNFLNLTFLFINFY